MSIEAPLLNLTAFCLQIRQLPTSDRTIIKIWNLTKYVASFSNDPYAKEVFGYTDSQIKAATRILKEQRGGRIAIVIYGRDYTDVTEIESLLISAEDLAIKLGAVVESNTKRIVDDIPNPSIPSYANSFLGFIIGEEHFVFRPENLRNS